MNFGKKRSKFHMQFCLGMLSHISSSKVCFVFEILHNFMEKNTRFFQWSAFFFSKMKSNPAKKTSEQRFSGKMKPTCQNIATCIFEHFQKWPKNLEGVLACSLSIIPSFRLVITTWSHIFIVICLVISLRKLAIFNSMPFVLKYVTVDSKKC